MGSFFNYSIHYFLNIGSESFACNLKYTAGVISGNKNIISNHTLDSLPTIRKFITK